MEDPRGEEYIYIYTYWKKNNPSLPRHAEWKSASRARHRKHVYPRDTRNETQVDEPTSTVKEKKRKEGRKEIRAEEKEEREKRREEKRGEKNGNSPQSQPGHFELPIPGRV